MLSLGVVFLITILFSYVITVASPVISEEAIEKNRVLEVKKAIEEGADVNARDDVLLTPLIYAAIYDSLEVAELLLGAGADINGNVSGVGGMTPLMWAADKNSLKVAKLLIDKGADVNAKSKSGKTALIIAEELGAPRDSEIITLLKKYGAK